MKIINNKKVSQKAINIANLYFRDGIDFGTSPFDLIALGIQLGLDSVESLKPQPGIWTVVKYLHNESGRYGDPKHIHLIEKDGMKMEVQLVGNIYDKTLGDKQPTTSDEDPEWESDWEKYEDFSINYFISKKVQIDSFDPLSISKIL